MKSNDLVRHIVTLLIVWMAFYVCSLIVTVCLPLMLRDAAPNLVLFGHETGIGSWVFFYRLVTRIPDIALVGVLIADMARRRTFDIADFFALVVTLLIGLPGALIYMLVPQRHVLYGGLLSINTIVNALIAYRALPPVLAAQLSDYNTYVWLFIHIVIMAVLIVETSRNAPAVARHLPVLVLIGLYFPACSVLLRFVLEDPEVDTRALRRYTVPFLVLSLLFVIDSIALKVLNPYIDTNYTFYEIHSVTMAVVNLFASLYVVVMMLCDRRVRAVPQHGWLVAGSLFAPNLLFSVARFCPTRETETLSPTPQNDSHS